MHLTGSGNITSKANSSSFRLGVRAKLLLSFAAVALTTIAATAIGFYSINQIEKSVDQITKHSVPSMAAAMRLAQRSDALESSMPLLTTIHTDAEHDQILNDLHERMKEMIVLGKQLDNSSELLGRMKKLDSGIDELDKSTRSRISKSKQLANTMKRLSETQSALDSLISTTIDDTNFDLMISTEETADKSAYMLEFMAKTSLQDLTSSLYLKSDINSLLINLTIVSESDDVKAIENLAARTKPLLSSINKYLTLLEERHEDEFLTLTINNMLAIAGNEKNVFQQRIKEIEAYSVSPFKIPQPSTKMLTDSFSRHERLNNSLTELSDNIFHELIEATNVIKKNTRETVPQLMFSGIDTLRQLLETRANSNVVFGILSEVYQVDSVELIQPLAERYEAVEATINDTKETINSLAEGETLITDINTLLSFGRGNESVFEQKKQTLSALDDTHAVLAAQNDLLVGILDTINRQVESSKQAVDAASQESSSTVTQSKIWLTIVVLSSLVVTVLIVWLQVSRYLVGRLLSVVTVLQKLSEGDLDCEIKVVGNDELSQLAQTVEVFREKAIENERLQAAEKAANKERDDQERDRRRLEAEQQTTQQQKHKQELLQVEREREQAESLKRDTDALLSVVSAASQGDLTHAVMIKGDHPTGQLGKGLEVLIGSFTEVMNQISNSADSVSTGSHEIAQGNSQLAARTEQQASNLAETSASMKEMTETVKQNTEDARQANQLADRAQERAEQGSQVVTEAVKAMVVINESSLQIADIVGVIDEIAFQTNLLALNASVEAARAGEQGRGFAVVASEVRNLAARSATAAKEIKELIEDTVRKVDHGVKLVDDSGKTLDELLGAVKSVTDIVGNIVSASEDQSARIQQVNTAVTKMDEMTQQNATLVQQVASASDSMANQSVKLAEQVSFFTFNELSSNDTPIDINQDLSDYDQTRKIA